MSSSRATPLRSSPAPCVLAALLAVLVFALGLLNVSPSAHHWLHAHDADHAAAHDDAGCAVTLFAHGATTTLDLPRVAAPQTVVFASLVAAPSRLLLTAAHHLTPPGRGPPCIG